MIISKIYNSASQDVKEGLVWGLILGLIWGLVWGLTVGLAWGLIWGLVLGLGGGLVLGLLWGLTVGLAWGLIWGLTVGLLWGLVWGLVVLLLNFKEAFPFLANIYPIILLILGIIILSEILFWLMPKEKIKQSKIFWHTFKRKIENIFEVLLGLSGIGQIYVLIREAKINITPEIWQGILNWIGYIGVGIIVLGVIIGLFYLWIKLNSLKYLR